jgi:hypothetical protein
MIKEYLKFINDSVEEKFQRGDKVWLRGTVDGSLFHDHNGTITDISVDQVRTNMNENGMCEEYTYKGICYYIFEADWWVSPFNLKLIEERIKQKFTPEDPYGEEIWEQNEAKKDEDKTLVAMDGNTIRLFNYSINYLLRSNDGNRMIVADMINRNIKGGKKVQFYNQKEDKNLKKVRIATGVYWKENQDNVWNLMLIGTKKDYCVNKNKSIGYYTDVVRTISPLDPYGEEIWD